MFEERDALRRALEGRGPEPGEDLRVSLRICGLHEYQRHRALTHGIQDTVNSGGRILECIRTVTQDPRELHPLVHTACVVLVVDVPGHGVFPTAHRDDVAVVVRQAPPEVFRLFGVDRHAGEGLSLLVDDGVGELRQAQRVAAAFRREGRVSTDLVQGDVLRFADAAQVDRVAVGVHVPEEACHPRSEEGLHHIVRDYFLVVVNDLDILQVVLSPVLLDRHKAAPEGLQVALQCVGVPELLRQMMRLDVHQVVLQLLVHLDLHQVQLRTQLRLQRLLHPPPPRLRMAAPLGVGCLQRVCRVDDRVLVPVVRGRILEVSTKGL
mmetsp:Transcript_37642/g.99521  ORF Transcript_37642/g.99521 Transcript_37642/m.99521 type:complete len:322 (-) Transcript_37642:375-1340(-)